MPFIVSPVLVLAAILAGALPAAGAEAEVVYFNANIYTGNPLQPQAKAMAVTGSRIVAVGDDLGEWVGPKTIRADLKGATVTAGFIDAHGHVAGLGQSLEVVDLRKASSAADAARMVREAAEKTAAGGWILGRGWDQTRWPGGEFPDRAPLDEAAPEHPVFLTRVDGHAAWVNQRALVLADVNMRTADPAGGRIIRKDGRVAGVLVDRAMGLVSRKIPPPDHASLRERIKVAARECARLGLTGVHDAGVGAGELAAYRELVARGRLPIRVYAMIGGAGDLWRETLARGPEVGDRLTIRSIKLMADGALGSRGAALKEPYSDDPEQSGLMILSREQVENVARDAVAAGFQVNTHAIGDRANRTVLDAYGVALGGKNDRRFRIEHAQVIAPDDFDLFAKFSIVASMQSTHATSDMRWAEERLGPKRIAGAYAWQQLLRRGVVLANGSDFPVESPDPMLGFYAAVTRQDTRGEPPGGWRPSDALSRVEALRSWTWAGAYAAFEERDKGTIEPGKLADFVVWSGDIMTMPAREIPLTRALRTVVGGQTVWREEFNGRVEIKPGAPSFFEASPRDGAAAMRCRFTAESSAGVVRAMLMSREEMEDYERKGWEKLADVGQYSNSRTIRGPVNPGEVLVFDSGATRRPLWTHVNIGFEYDAPQAPRTVSRRRMWVVIAASLSFLGAACGIGGWRVMRAFRRRDEAEY
ncbi:MAG: amidohydrolase [Bryobacteraceae bacterium]